MLAERIQRLMERDEVAWDEPGSLMNELIERVLTIRSRLAPVNRTRLILNLRSFERDVFAIALHGQLLEVGRESLQILFVGKHRDRFRTKEICVPDVKQAHQ